MDIEEAKNISLRVSKEKEEKERIAAERRRREAERVVESRATSIINKTNEKLVPEAANSGLFSCTPMVWYSGQEDHAVSSKVQEYFRNQGFKTRVEEMEPFGSDPVFYHTVYTLHISWNDDDSN